MLAFMKEKLTLTIDKETKKRAKIYARSEGVSLSKIVESYLKSLSSPEHDPLYNLGNQPVSAGVTDASEDHDRYLYKSSGSRI